MRIQQKGSDLVKVVGKSILIHGKKNWNSLKSKNDA